MNDSHQNSIPNPTLGCHDGWQQQLAEHRRRLLEKLIAEFPDVLTTKKSTVDLWRLRLRIRVTDIDSEPT